MDRLGAGIAEILFRETSVGVVTAVALADGRRVVVKVHQPRERMDRLRAVHDVQTRLHRAGFPCPEPLIEPVALGNATPPLRRCSQTASSGTPTIRRADD